MADQSNLLAASLEYKKLQTLMKEMKPFLQDFGVFESFKKRVADKQKTLQTQILLNMQDLLFTRSLTQIERKLSIISQLINAGKMTKIEEDTELIEYICKETLDVKKIQDLLSKVHQKDFDAANKALQLIISSIDDDQADENI